MCTNMKEYENRHNTKSEGPKVGSLEPWSSEIYVEQPGARSPVAGARSPEPGARSPEPGARSREPGARSPEPGARSPEPGAQGLKPLSLEPRQKC